METFSSKRYFSKRDRGVENEVKIHDVNDLTTLCLHSLKNFYGFTLCQDSSFVLVGSSVNLWYREVITGYLRKCMYAYTRTGVHVCGGTWGWYGSHPTKLTVCTE